MPGHAAPMVGRAAESAALRDAFTAGQAGDLRIVVVRGEAGIGKTLELWPQVPDAPQRAQQNRTALALEVCERWSEVGDMPRMLRLTRDALAGAPEDDVLGRAAAHRLMAVAMGNLSRIRESAASARAGIALVEDRADPEGLALHAMLLSQLAAAIRPGDGAAVWPGFRRSNRSRTASWCRPSAGTTMPTLSRCAPRSATRGPTSSGPTPRSAWAGPRSTSNSS